MTTQFESISGSGAIAFDLPRWPKVRLPPNQDPAFRRWGPMALVVIGTPSHNRVMELPMIDGQVRVADALGHGVRPRELNADRLGAFQIVSTAGNSGAGALRLGIAGGSTS
jgi:hypothetical protein